MVASSVVEKSYNIRSNQHLCEYSTQIKHEHYGYKCDKQKSSRKRIKINRPFSQNSSGPKCALLKQIFT